MATVSPRLQALRTAWNVPDENAILVDLAKASGILQTALVRPSNFGPKHKYKLHNSLPASSFRGMGGTIIPTLTSMDSAELDLWILEAQAEYDYQYIDNYPGGKLGWIADNLGAYLEGMGQAWGKQMIYGGTSLAASTSGFVGFHAYAKALGNVVAQLGGASASRTSIFCVRWNEFDGASVRINRPDGGDLINVKEINNGAVYPTITDTTTNARMNVYGWLLNAYNTLVVPSKKSVSVITQIDSTHKPTVGNMESLVNGVYGGTGDKFIYTNLTGLGYINELKGAKLSLYTESKDYDTALGYWAGIPIIVDENILSTETSAID